MEIDLIYGNVTVNDNKSSLTTEIHAMNINDFTLLDRKAFYAAHVFFDDSKIVSLNYGNDVLHIDRWQSNADKTKCAFTIRHTKIKFNAKVHELSEFADAEYEDFIVYKFDSVAETMTALTHLLVTIENHFTDDLTIA